MAKISHGKKPREILFIDQLLIYLSLFPLACSGFDVAGLLKDGDHQGRIGRAEIGICKPQRRATAFILPLEILSAGTVVVLNGRCAEGFGEAFACGFKMLFCRAARKLFVERQRKQLVVFVKLRIKFAGAACGLHDVLRQIIRICERRCRGAFADHCQLRADSGFKLRRVDAERRSGIRIAGLGIESESVCLFHGCLRRTADKREHQNKGQNQCELFHKTTSYDDVRICGYADGYGGANEFVL